MNNWKQPTPTDIRDNPNVFAFDRAVFYEIWSMTRREDGICRFLHGNKPFVVALKRGQCVFRVASYAEQMGVDRKKVVRSLEILKNWYTELDIIGRAYGCIITFLRYDDLIKMDNEQGIKGTSKGHHKDIIGTASKESVKTEEKEESEKYFEDEKTNSLFLDFLEMRKQKKMPATNIAIKMLVKKLQEQTKNVYEKNIMIENAIEHEWKSFYPLKDEELLRAKKIFARIDKKGFEEEYSPEEYFKLF